MSDASDDMQIALALNTKLAAELAATQQQLASARAEIAELKKLAVARDTWDGGAAQGASEELALSAEERALERARQGIGELEAQVGGQANDPSSASPPAKKPSKAEAEEQARQQFEALRAERTKPPTRTM